MPSFDNCPYCGAVLRSDERVCPGCGAPNAGFSPAASPELASAPAPAPAPSARPRTIQELQAYCRYRRMPLDKMRFFIGEDYRRPQAFGIYRDGANVVVYKNKSNGDRAVRYQGPDEARAVGEIFDKLLEECHKRGIYPEGSPPARGGTSSAGSRSSGNRSRVRKGGFFPGCLSRIGLIFAILLLLGGIVSACSDRIGHGSDGYYYLPGDSRVYYHYGDSWYYTSYYDEPDSWYETSFFPEDDIAEYSLGDTWDSAWGVGDFRESSTWDYLNDSSSSYYDSNSSYWDSYDDDDSWSSWDDSDWDSWDSGSTDWDSDW